MPVLKIKAVLLSLLLLQSCAQVTFHSSHKTPVYAFAREGHHEQISVVGRRDFYLWGLVPRPHEVDLSQVMASAGLMSSAALSLEDYQTFSDKLWSLVTLGLYLPRHFRVRAWGLRQGEGL